MRKRSFLLALAAGFLACSLGATNTVAGTVNVYQDAGTFNYTITASIATLAPYAGDTELTFTYSNAQLSTINNVTVPNISSSFETAHLYVTGSTVIGPFTIYTLGEPGGATKTFGPPSATQQAVLENVVTAGSTTTGFLNVNGTITGVLSPDLQLTPTSTVYNFSAYADPATIALSYQSNGFSYANMIKTGTGSVSGTGAISENVAVPEPSSMALLGVGLSCLIAARRYFKRRRSAG